MCVYFIQVKQRPIGLDGMVKIGSSAAPEKRLAQLQASIPYKLAMIRLFAGGREDEKRIHRVFSELRQSGEWFRYCEEMLSRNFGLLEMAIPEPCPKAMFAQFQPAVTRAWRERRRAATTTL